MFYQAQGSSSEHEGFQRPIFYDDVVSSDQRAAASTIWSTTQKDPAANMKVSSDTFFATILCPAPKAGFPALCMLPSQPCRLSIKKSISQTRPRLTQTGASLAYTFLFAKGCAYIRTHRYTGIRAYVHHTCVQTVQVYGPTDPT